MDIKARIKEKLNEMLNADDLNRSEKKILKDIKPEFVLRYHGQDFPLKAKTLKGAKVEAVKVSTEKNFPVRHADIIEIRKVYGMMGKPSNVETRHSLMLFNPLSS